MICDLDITLESACVLTNRTVIENYVVITYEALSKSTNLCWNRNVDI